MLFSMFINELYTLMSNSNARGIQLFPDTIEIFLLMFADDIALTSDTVIGLQRHLNLIKDFCDTSKLKFHISKTKLLVFKRVGRLAKREKWTYGENVLEVVNGFTYVGVYFSSRLSFYKMAETMAIKAKRVFLHIFSSLQHLQSLPSNTFF